MQIACVDVIGCIMCSTYTEVFRNLFTLSKNQYLSSSVGDSDARVGAAGAPLAGGAAAAATAPLLDRPAHTYSVSPAQPILTLIK